MLLIPSARPPHRREGPFASYEDRFQMVALACHSLEDISGTRFEASRLEEGPEISYSIHTIERVQELCAPGSLYLLIGADAFSDIHSWHRATDVIAAVRFIVVSRPGAEYEIPAGAQVERLEELDLPISSSDIRRKLAEGNPDIEVPQAVLDYIHGHRLYDQENNSPRPHVFR